MRQCNNSRKERPHVRTKKLANLDDKLFAEGISHPTTDAQENHYADLIRKRCLAIRKATGTAPDPRPWTTPLHGPQPAG